MMPFFKDKHMSVGEGREAAIRGLNAYKEELEAQIRQMQENLRCVEKSIEILGTANGGRQLGIVTVTSNNPVTISRYANLKPQAAVKLFLMENPNRWWKASVVAKELLARGMPKTSKAFSAAITGTCDRLARKGFAIREKREGVNMYCLGDNGMQGGDRA